MAFINSESTKSLALSLFLFLILVGPTPSFARTPHVINFRSLNRYPEGLTWDPSAQHFVVGSQHHRTIHSVSDAAVVETLISDPTLPENATILGLAIDSIHNRLLALVHSAAPLPPFNALAAYDLRSRRRVFLSLLDDETPGVITIKRHVANDVAVDFNGNAYVTNSAGNFIWKVDKDGEDLVWADGIAVRSDGVVLVVSHHTLWFIKSHDSWAEGVVYDKTALNQEKFATSVTVGGEDRAYVLYGRVMEGLLGNSGREEFSIEEVRSKKENEEENVWVFVLLGLGLAYFLFWRFQMSKLVRDINKKTN
ncbi:hypothetical protein CICLE_v10015653mg [Citrus x clementina]|uniref:SMP-30/Gluconolactonase/LRE-like region domain-containing protein n=1 Tax=Citrus clementina TaxID=85681 RepID=V4W5Z0_CITCL|nr:hypothetical protein CICLE_v10015653mg [Citrus x clementina]